MSPFGACSARISGDRQTHRHTHRQTHRPSTVTLAAHAGAEGSIVHFGQLSSFELNFSCCDSVLFLCVLCVPSPMGQCQNELWLMKGDIGMVWSSKKERNKEWLLSKATENYMTPSLYLCH